MHALDFSRPVQFFLWQIGRSGRIVNPPRPYDLPVYNWSNAILSARPSHFLNWRGLFSRSMGKQSVPRTDEMSFSGPTSHILYGQIRYVEIAHTQITSKISPTDRAKSARPSKNQPDRPRISNQVLPRQIYVICPYGKSGWYVRKTKFRRFVGLTGQGV